jgi:hypothetical protein
MSREDKLAKGGDLLRVVHQQIAREQWDMTGPLVDPKRSGL